MQAFAHKNKKYSLNAKKRNNPTCPDAQHIIYKIPMNLIKKFFAYDGASGILLMVATAAALIIYNSPLSHIYDEVLHTYIKVGFGEFALKLSAAHWINDALMAIFFLTVGLEIKRELVEGALREFKKALLPFIAAIGGVVVPALIYVYFNHANPDTAGGWGIPVATDIAFAVGVLALLGRHVPRELKILLLSIAIIDDLIAILVIAIFYTAEISMSALGAAGIVLAILVIMNLNNVKNLPLYTILGAILWVCILKSGVHATIAGVLLALTIPITIKNKPEISPLKHLEHGLYPWAAFLIMPVFAFANAGFSLQGIKLEMFMDPVPLGIILGLFFGKQIGVFGFIWLSDKIGIINKPEQVGWRHIYGLAILTGIGFTVSLFIGNLAFADAPYYLTEVRMSVITASALAAIFGFAVLRFSSTWDEIKLDNINPISHPEVFGEDDQDEEKA